LSTAPADSNGRNCGANIKLADQDTGHSTFEDAMNIDATNTSNADIAMPSEPDDTPMNGA
jgi:COMPASS component BRE2